MDRISEAIRGLSTGRRVLQTLALLIVTGGALFRYGPYGDVQAAVGGAVLPEETVTTPAELASFLEKLGEAGRESYAAFQLWDLLNPILIGLFSVTMISWLIRVSNLSHGRALALLVPIIAPVVDLAENAVLFGAIAAFPTSVDTVGLLPFLTGAKFAGLAATLALGVVLTALALVRRQRPRTAAT